MSEADQIELLTLLREAVPLLKQVVTATPAASGVPPTGRQAIRKMPKRKITPAETLAYLETFLPGISRFVPLQITAS